jgi:DNA-binding beta-propeller fold protein YncE
MALIGNHASRRTKEMLISKLSRTLLTVLACSAVVPLSAQGRLIAVDSSRALFEIDMNTGAKTQIGTVSANAGTTGGLAYDRVADRIYLTSTSLDSVFELDLATGNATLIGPYGPDVVMHGIEWDSSTNTLYAASSTPNAFYKVDTSTGAATLIGNIGLTSFNNLGYDSDNDVMYMTNSNTDSLYRINRATGVPTLVGALGGPTNPNGLAYNFVNKTMYLIDNTTDVLYTLNLTTGAATAVGSTGTGNLLGLMYYDPIPEPGTMLAVGVGLAALARRRRA